jgi:hypothetical protein
MCRARLDETGSERGETFSKPLLRHRGIIESSLLHVLEAAYAIALHIDFYMTFSVLFGSQAVEWVDRGKELYFSARHEVALRLGRT